MLTTEAVPLDRGSSRLDRVHHWSFSGIDPEIDLVYSLHELCCHKKWRRLG